MPPYDWIRSLIEYGDWANDLLLSAAAGLDDDRLDRALEIGPGPGTLRRILTHTWAGEFMWLARWRGRLDVYWPNEDESLGVVELRSRFHALRPERDGFLHATDDAQLALEQPYRDSKGSMFRATLSDMILQGIVHSTHHRAQAANALRRLGGPMVELDYMMRIRKPA